MNWKTTSVIWGAGLLATWYAAIPPSQVPANLPPPQPRDSAPAAAASEIEQEAARLQARLQRQGLYSAPTRDPFRFGAFPEAGVGGGAPASTSEPALDMVEPPAPLLVLIGVAADEVDGEMERTAVLKTASGVTLVRVGDHVLNRYRVERVEAGSVDLTGLQDGLAVHLTFTP